MWESGLMTRLTDMVFICIQMEQDMKVNGSTISNKVKVVNHGQMVLFSRAITLKVRKKEKDTLSGLTVVTTKVNSRIITFMVWVTIDGPMEELTMENGNSIRCTDQVSSLGTMEESMKGNTTMIKSKVMVFSHGQMEENTKAAG
jgi:hypothetical protein